MYCKNCGKEMNDNQAICLNCGVKAGTGNSYCPNCGNQVSEIAAICVQCGILLKEPKPAPKNVEKATRKSKGGILPLILKFILTGLAIAFLFVDGYFSYYYRSSYSYYGYHTTGSFAYLLGFNPLHIIPVTLLAVSLILSFVNTKIKNIFVGIAETVISLSNLIVMIVLPIIAADDFFFVSSYSRRTFSNFNFLFYLEIVLNSLLMIVSAYIGILRPILNKKKVVNQISNI